jgi:sulfur carrier protein ThiS
MARVVFRLYAALNDRLPPDRRQRSFEAEVPAGQGLGDALRDLGVDAARIDLALVNGDPSPLSHPLADGDRVAAYPVFESLDLASLRLAMREG